MYKGSGTKGSSEAHVSVQELVTKSTSQCSFKLDLQQAGMSQLPRGLGKRGADGKIRANTGGCNATVR